MGWNIKKSLLSIRFDTGNNQGPTRTEIRNDLSFFGCKMINFET